MKRLLVAGIVAVVLAVLVMVSVHAGQTRVVLCHKGRTITVAEPAVAVHLAHGDILDACSASPEK